jgi:hypothetical protein
MNWQEYELKRKLKSTKDYSGIDRVKHLTRTRPISAEAQSYQPDTPIWVLCTVNQITNRYEGVVIRPLEKQVLVRWQTKDGKLKTGSLPLRRLEKRK